MIPVVSREQSRAFDRAAIHSGVPGVVLMENAGRGAADVIAERWPLPGAKVVILAGPGNNGGDGFVLARHLGVRGAAPHVFLAGESSRLTGDARIHHDAAHRLGVPIHERAVAANLARALEGATLAVDALFGTGLSRAVAETDKDLLLAIERSGRPVVAVDLPSGLDADTGVPLGFALRADVTVTFGFYKRGLLTPSGADLAGRVHVADIGAPPSLLQAGAAQLVERADVSKLLVPRRASVHKGAAGHVVVIAGSRGHVGAAVMCARAALRTGAGLVTVASWPEVVEALDGRVVEVMTSPFSRDDVDGSVARVLERAKSVVMGPGLGKDDDARRVAQRVLEVWKGPIVVDADALAMFAGNPEAFSVAGAAILTPHPGEMGMLLGLSAKEVEQDRWGALESCAVRSGAVTVLKGAHTLIGHKGRAPVVNGSGSSALATAGSGDVLGGTIAALSCSLDPFDAAYAGVHLHGLAGEAWSQRHGDRGLLASEVCDSYPGLFRALTTSHADCPGGHIQCDLPGENRAISEG